MRKHPVQNHKVCAGCKVDKPADQFYVGSAGRLRSRCASCYAQHNLNQRAIHAEKREAYDKQRGTGWTRSGRAKYEAPEPAKWAAYIKRVYKLTVEAFESMLTRQGGVCAICRGECNRSTTTRMCVDHDHATKKVRGLLCFQCNVGLGKFKDSPDLLRAAADYLERQS